MEEGKRIRKRRTAAPPRRIVPWCLVDCIIVIPSPATSLPFYFTFGPWHSASRLVGFIPFSPARHSRKFPPASAERVLQRRLLTPGTHRYPTRPRIPLLPERSRDFVTTLLELQRQRDAGTKCRRYSSLRTLFATVSSCILNTWLLFFAQYLLPAFPCDSPAVPPLLTS